MLGELAEERSGNLGDVQLVGVEEVEAALAIAAARTSSNTHFDAHGGGCEGCARGVAAH